MNAIFAHVCFRSERSRMRLHCQRVLPTSRYKTTENPHRPQNENESAEIVSSDTACDKQMTLVKIYVLQNSNGLLLPQCIAHVDPLNRPENGHRLCHS